MVMGGEYGYAVEWGDPGYGYDVALASVSMGGGWWVVWAMEGE